MAGEHLKPHHFKKGQSGNPSGRAKKSIEVEQKRLITYEEFVDLVTRFSKMKRAEMKEYLERPEATMFELVYGKLIVQAANGDKSARDMLTERLFGKVKDVVETHNTNVEVGPPVFVVEMSENGKFVSQRPQLLKVGESK
jgi:hypothetical protein